ncbi:hypothetical protein THRCLA_03135 [Thraustotheca clavata]|uniref:GAF domain-containing protein n=1 Tax=Thraustotheca clavata TaxID=74557 RepID=A0A1W0A322_9STRA|nr:hypothetical protein THRCLA_03135 [Thraustotheca clavata]
MEQASAWPEDIDLDHMYMDGRKNLERVITNSMDMNHWSMIHHKHDTWMYKHQRNSANQLMAMRLVTQVNMPLEYTIELLRLLDSTSYRTTMKDLHGKSFLDGEVLHSHVRHNEDLESLALKWCAMSTGKAFTKPKEFLFYEYWSLYNSEKYGPAAICLFESYDGIGAKYGIRAKPDSYKLAWFEPSSFVITPAPDGHRSVVTLTIACRKAGGSNLVSPALRNLVTKFTQAYGHLSTCSSTLTIVERSQYMHQFKRQVSRTTSTSSKSFNDPDQSRRKTHHDVARSSNSTASSSEEYKSKKISKRQEYVNEDFAEICHTAMQSLGCPMAGIRTNLFEIVQYSPTADMSLMPKSLPTFRRMAQTGKPCVVLDVHSDKRISDEKRQISRVQFFVGVPMILDSGECIGDVCVADIKPRKVIDYTQLEILKVLAQSATAYMTSSEYLAETTDLPCNEDTRHHSSQYEDDNYYQHYESSSSSSFEYHRQYEHPAEDIPIENLGIKEVAF